MSKVTAPAILTREALPDAPEGQWVDTLLENTNSFQDQVRTVLQNGLSIGDNTPWKFQDYNLKHGIETEIKNPFDDPAMAIKKISVARAVGITLDSTGKPDGGTYTIMQPQIGWRPSGKPSGSVFVTVQYAQYERGTWTPTIGPFSSGSVAYSNQIGTFVRQEALVTAFWRVQLSGITAPVSTGLGLIGMPYAIANIGAGAIGFSSGMTGITGYITHRFGVGSNNLAIHNNGNYTGELLGSNLTASSHLFGTFSYLTDNPATTARVTLLFQGA